MLGSLADQSAVVQSTGEGRTDELSVFYEPVLLKDVCLTQSISIEVK